MADETEAVVVEKSPIVEKMEHLVSVLDIYERTVGLANIGVKDEVDGYINLSILELNKMSAEECGNAAYIIEQRAYHVQMQLNKEVARITWADDLIEKAVLPRMNNYKAFKDEDKMKLAIQDDDYTKKLQEIKIYARMRIDRLSFMANRLNNLANKLDSLQQTKRRIRYGQD
jgi:hypothetical protein